MLARTAGKLRNKWEISLDQRRESERRRVMLTKIQRD